jgi:hypothetical protein
VALTGCGRTGGNYWSGTGSPVADRSGLADQLKGASVGHQAATVQIFTFG